MSVSLQARQLSLYGPFCRDLDTATELNQERFLAFNSWYHASCHWTYKNSTSWTCWKKGRKQWMAYCEWLCEMHPEFRCTDGSTSYSFVSPASMDSRAFKRHEFCS